MPSPSILRRKPGHPGKLGGTSDTPTTASKSSSSMSSSESPYGAYSAAPQRPARSVSASQSRPAKPILVAKSSKPAYPTPALDVAGAPSIDSPHAFLPEFDAICLTGDSESMTGHSQRKVEIFPSYITPTCITYDLGGTDTSVLKAKDDKNCTKLKDVIKNEHQNNVLDSMKCRDQRLSVHHLQPQSWQGPSLDTRQKKGKRDIGWLGSTNAGIQTPSPSAVQLFGNQRQDSFSRRLMAMPSTFVSALASMMRVSVAAETDFLHRLHIRRPRTFGIACNLATSWTFLQFPVGAAASGSESDTFLTGLGIFPGAFALLTAFTAFFKSLGDDVQRSWKKISYLLSLLIILPTVVAILSCALDDVGLFETIDITTGLLSLGLAFSSVAALTYGGCLKCRNPNCDGTCGSTGGGSGGKDTLAV